MPRSDQHIEVPGSVQDRRDDETKYKQTEGVEAKYTGVRGMVGPGVEREQVSRS